MYLVKIPYITFAKSGDKQTRNFLTGLEERYGVEGLGTTEKRIFDKLNGITSGEGHIFAQAVDDIFEAKSDYHSYGAAVKNELGYDIRMSPKTHLRPFGTIKMEYGRFGSIEEESGQMKLAVKGNDYISVKPEVGVEFRYVQPLAVRTNLSIGLSASYENEIGKLQKGNQARVRKTTANWYNLEKEKENRSGNGKFDLKVGVDNTRFGVTANFGYETKVKNVKGGIGLRAIF